MYSLHLQWSPRVPQFRSTPDEPPWGPVVADHHVQPTDLGVEGGEDVACQICSNKLRMLMRFVVKIGLIGVGMCSKMCKML